MKPNNTFKTITIIGLGLMGGSLAAACRKKFPRAKITGVSRSLGALKQAKRLGWIHEGTGDLAAGIKQADLAILATPVDTLARLLLQIESARRPPALRGLLVTDVGSIKGDLQAWADRRRWKNISFVGAHPMTGSHERGIAAASAGIYDHGFTFIVRGRSAKPAAYRAVLQFWKKISPKVVEISAKAHDRITSDISHLPHAVAMSLVLSVKAGSLKFAASGFRDTTRIALGDASIWAPILAGNRKALAESLAGFEKSLARVRAAISSKDRQNLAKLIGEAARRRRQI